MVDYTCNPVCLGGEDQKDHGLRLTGAKHFGRPHLNQ
jgi:hypothetical protein